MSTQGRAQFTPGPWYAANMGNDFQGLVVEEQTGKNIAVAYDKRDVHILAAAPAMYGELSVSTNLLCRALPYLPDAVAKELVKQRQINMQVLSQAEGRQV